MRINNPIRLLSTVAVLCVLAVLIGLYTMLPQIVERRVVDELQRKGIQVTDLSIRSVGVTTGSMGPGGLRMDRMELAWDGMKLQYLPWSLVSKGADHLEMDHPQVILDFTNKPLAESPIFDLEETGENTPLVVERESREHEGDDLAAAPSPLTSSIAPEATEAPGKKKMLLDFPKIEAADVFHLFSGIPVSEIAVQRGSLTVKFPWNGQFGADWSANLLLGKEMTLGELSLAGEGHEAKASISGVRATDFLSAGAEINLDLSRCADLFRQLSKYHNWPDSLITYRMGGSAHVELLAETQSGGQLALSGQAELGAFQIDDPSRHSVIRVESIQLAGSSRSERSLLSAGLRFGPSVLQGLQLSPFGATLNVDGKGLFRTESEQIGLSVDDGSARAAFRGSGLLNSRGQISRAHVEWTLDEINGFPVDAEPFSMLVEYEGSTVRGKVTPLGLRREGTIWIENAEPYWDMDTKTGGGTFQWYDPSGALAGGVRAKASAAGEGGYRISATLADRQDRDVAELEYAFGDTTSLKAEGHLPLAWLNSLLGWWGISPGRFSGDSPFLRVDLSGKPPFMKGAIELEVADVGFESSNGVVVEGIQFDPHFRIDYLPRTNRIEALRIGLIKRGGVSLENLIAQWEWPVLHRLEIRSVRATLEEGTVWSEAFSLNPLNPDFQTDIHFEGLPAGRIIEWLNESRFSFEGTLSGTLQVGWSKGVFLIGNGRFQMAENDPDARFRITDKQFIDDYLGSLSSIPVDLRERFKEALLEEGILLHELEMALYKPDVEGQVLLRIRLSGESRTDRLEIPIKGIVINNFIPEEDLARLLGVFGSIRVMSTP